MTEPQAHSAPTTTPIRVVVADDQAAIRDALGVMLDLYPDIDVVGTADNGAVAVELVRAHRPDVLLTDLRMPVLDGTGATTAVAHEFPDIAVVLLTTYADEESILAALQAGARGYLTKEAGREEIANAIRAAAAGQSVLDPAVQQRLVAAALGSTGAAGAPVAGTAVPASPAPASTSIDFTKRELEVLGLIAQGLSNRAIANQLFVGESTVKTHINNIFAKAHWTSRTQAVGFAYENGLVGNRPQSR